MEQVHQVEGTAPVRHSAIQRRVPKRDSLEIAKVLMYAAPIAALPAVGLGVAGVFGRGPAFLRRHPIVSAALACGGIAVLIKSQLDRFLLEKPEYDVVGTFEEFEVRLYRPRLVAETTVETTSFDEAREEGFRRLAAYIFGENVPKEQLPMNAPVSLHRAAAEEEGEQMAMTTPVTLTRSRAGFVMRFQMPREREFESLPAPSDPRVHLRRIGGERVAVLKFRGKYDAERIGEKQQELVQLARARGIAVAGEPVFAGYDSPATLPFIRRVEVWVPVARV